MAATVCVVPKSIPSRIAAILLLPSPGHGARRGTAGRDRARGRRRTAAGALPLAQARLERFHEVDDLGLGACLGRRLGDVLALQLLLDELLDPLADDVLV